MAPPPLKLLAAAIAALVVLVLVVFALRRWCRRRRLASEAAAAVPAPVAVQVKIRTFWLSSSYFESLGGETAVFLGANRWSSHVLKECCIETRMAGRLVIEGSWFRATCVECLGVALGSCSC
jgi:hypothetical protein